MKSNEIDTSLICSKDDFILLVQQLESEIKSDPNCWTNNTLISFLGAMSDWVEHMESYYSNNKIPLPSNNWRVFSDILIASTMYE
jgi:hypothetical protein